MSYHLGLDLGGTYIKFAVLESACRGIRVLTTGATETRSEEGPHAVLERVVGLGREAAGPFGGVDSVGLGLPGHFDPTDGTGVLLPNLKGDWVGQPIAGPVAEGLGREVSLVNDVRALTLAELRLGAGRGARNLVCIALGTGVGGGIVIDGELYVGLAHAGEIGHQTVEPDGPPCGCGNRGCLDRVAGADVVAREAGRTTAAEVVEAAQAGDERALAALERATRAIGIAIANAIVLLWPERVVVGGGLAEAGDAVLERVRAEVRRRASVAPVDRIPLVKAELGAAAGAVGAALWGREALARAG